MSQILKQIEAFLDSLLKKPSSPATTGFEQQPQPQENLIAPTSTPNEQLQPLQPIQTATTPAPTTQNSVPFNYNPYSEPTTGTAPTVTPAPTQPKPTYINIVLNIAEPVDGGKTRLPIQGVKVTPNCEGVDSNGNRKVFYTDNNGNAYFKAMRPASAPQFTGNATTANYAAMIEKTGYRGGNIGITVNASDPDTKTIQYWMMKA